MSRPQPAASAATREFWEACGRGELLYQVCTHCMNVQFYPRAHCTKCMNHALRWERSSGRGTVYSYTTAYRAATPAFKDDVPYIIALADLAEGFRMMLNVVGPNRAEIAIGRELRIVFRSVDGGAALPQGELV